MNNLIRKPTALVVDDDENTLLLMKHNLDRIGYEVISAENGRVGLDKVFEADVVIADTQMPIMDGPSFCRYARSYGYIGPIIGTSNSDMPSLPQEWKMAGATIYEDKRIIGSRAGLVSVLAQALSYRLE